MRLDLSNDDMFTAVIASPEDYINISSFEVFESESTSGDLVQADSDEEDYEF